MNYIYWLSQIQNSEQLLVGDKLFILSQLLQHECPILPGLVLGNNLFKDFLASLEINQSLTNLNVDDYQALQAVATRSRQIIHQAVFHPSWQSEIYQATQQLNSESLIIQPFVTISHRQHQVNNSLWRSRTCSANPEALVIAIKQVYSQLFTASSLFYWQKLGISSEQINLALLIRPLKAAYASGTIELDSNLIRIKATWGLETSLLQGDVEPDEYYINRQTEQIISRSLGHKNYAYRPQNVSAATSLTDCLEAYTPSENHTETYVLEPKTIAQLLQSTQVILQQQPQIRYLVWTIPAVTHQATSTPNFYFTYLDEDLATNELVPERVTHTLMSSLSPKPLLTGVAASPGQVIADVVILDENRQSQSIPPGSILVTKAIAPHHIPLIQQVAGIITEKGGKTSHGAIVARELNIPAVVNVTDATSILQTGVKVLLNGDEGKIYHPTTRQKSSLANLSTKHLLAPNAPIATKLMVNLSQPASIVKTQNLPVDGIGLLRADLLLADLLTSRTSAQWQDKSFRSELVRTLSDYLRQFVSAFAPRPVFYRSLDWYPHNSMNPILSNRGTYSYLADPTLFDLELKALAVIKTEGYNNLNLILPFVRSVEEFKFCYRRLENIGLTANNSLQVWIMAEVPSVIFLLPEYVRAGVQGIAIGTNDLTQLLLGVDREKTEFSDRGLNANHPAMHQAIAQLIATAQANNIECCICGQAPVDYPSLIDKLINWGITSISVEPEAVERTYQAIARAERRLLLQAAISNY
ncbi:MAG: putative PEP-binding protein [Waterburya sp.]